MFSSKKLAGVVVALSLFTFAVAPAVQASGLSSTQISAILSLLQSFGADQGTINNVSAALGGSPSTSQSCVNLSSNLTLGSSGSDVISLQNYLISKGDLTGTSATGYYGYLTASAVGQLQLSLGIVSSQNDSAYGIMGPRTRAAVGCGGNTTPVVTSNNLAASPASGAAPLTVNFTTTMPSSNDLRMDFGDGTKMCKYSGEDIHSTDCWADVGGGIPFPYTYTNAGTYTAKLESCTTSSGVPCNILGTATITVTGGSTSSTQSNTGPALTATPTSGQAPLLVTFTATGLGGYPTSIEYGDTNITAPLPQGNTATVSHTYTSSGIYEVSLCDTENCGGSSLNINVTGNASSPSASINQSSLTANSATPTITGTAQNVSQLTVSVLEPNAMPTGYFLLGQDMVSVVNGTWSYTIPSKDQLAPGTYKISISGNTTLATGTLTVAYIPQSTLTALQVQAVANLLTSFGASAATMANVQAVLSGQRYASAAPSSVTGNQIATIENLLQGFGASQDLDNAVRAALNGQ